MTEINPFEGFVNSFQGLIVAVVGEQLAKNGVIGKYPESFAKDIKKARTEIIEFLSAQDPDAKK